MFAAAAEAPWLAGKRGWLRRRDETLKSENIIVGRGCRLAPVSGAVAAAV
jgi:hypothetical protein